ncbi:MAG: AAA family ATPase [Candidatus Aenigmatarchaeota archaeon]|nr:MAG: AAA family ATPase [Candidatus Aenigmarchaeota archaeon]
MLVVIVGMPCSGKTTALDVCKELGADPVSSGDVVREEIEKRGLPYTEETDRDVAGWFHEKGRERVLVQRVLARLKSNPKTDFVAIDGLRDVVQLKILEELAGVKPVVISVEAPFGERLRRCLLRKRFEEEDKAYLLSRDEVENARGLGRLISKADHAFDTEGMDEATFRREFGKFIRKLLM